MNRALLNLFLRLLPELLHTVSRHSRWEQIRVRLPMQGALQDQAHALLEALQDLHALDSELFDLLRERYPRLEEEIDLAQRGAGAWTDLPPAAPGALEIHVPRPEAEAELLRALCPPPGTRTRPVFLVGAAGVGKTHLAQWFIGSQGHHYPDGAQILSLQEHTGWFELFEALASSLELEVRELGPFLSQGRKLLVLEAADNAEGARLAAAVQQRFPRAALLVTGRFQGLGQTPGSPWLRVEVPCWSREQAQDYLRRALAGHKPRGHQELGQLIQALGGHPLALRLSSGLLRRHFTVPQILQRLEQQQEGLRPIDVDGSEPDLMRGMLWPSWSLSLDELRKDLSQADPELYPRLFDLGVAPLAGFGEGMARAITGLDEADWQTLRLAAESLSLMENLPDTAEPTWKIHPLLALLLRLRSPDTLAAAAQRLKRWFMTHLDPEPVFDRPQRWDALAAAPGALEEWLLGQDPADQLEALRAGEVYANTQGPSWVWLACTHRVLTVLPKAPERLEILLQQLRFALNAGSLNVAQIALRNAMQCAARLQAFPLSLLEAQAEVMEAEGALEDAIEVLEQQVLPLAQGGHSKALILSHLARLYAQTGAVTTAQRILVERVIPALEALDEPRDLALAWGQLGNICEQNQDLDGALEIRLERELPVLERLADQRAIAIAYSSIARIHGTKGRFDDAQEILEQLVLPTLGTLGDERNLALAWGLYADLLQTRGALQGSLELREHHELSAWERLGDRRSLAQCHMRMAAALADLGQEAVAIDKLGAAILVLRALQADSELLLAHRMLGLLHLRLGQITEGREQLYIALDLAEDLGSPLMEELAELLGVTFSLPPTLE